MRPSVGSALLALLLDWLVLRGRRVLDTMRAVMHLIIGLFVTRRNNNSKNEPTIAIML